MSSSHDIDSVDPKIVTRYDVGQKLGKGACARASDCGGWNPLAHPSLADVDARA